MMFSGKELLKSMLALFIGLVLAFGIAEVALRLYNPFAFRVKGNSILLPANQKYVIKNTRFHKLDSIIIHTKNSIGFRGPELPDHPEAYTKIIAVGGSTTECYNLSDGKEWAALLAGKLMSKERRIWINNAGLDGQSTFGHRILLEDHLAKLRPDLILYLVGCNDVGREDLSKYETDKLRNRYSSFINRFTKNSEVVSLIENLVRGIKARKSNLRHVALDLNTLEHTPVDTSAIHREITRHAPLIGQYRTRLTSLIRETKQSGIQPVLLTQPTMAGEGTDPVTGQNLETVKIDNHPNARTYWLLLEAYNNATREVAQAEGVPLIDLAHRMPKSSLYFYDNLHFTHQGAEKVSEILFGGLDTLLRD